MNARIFFISENQEELDFFKRKRDSLIPSEIRNKYSIKQNIVFDTILFQEDLNRAQEILLNKSKENDFVVCIVDNTVKLELFDSLLSVFLFFTLKKDGNLQQNFSSLLSRIIPVIFFVRRKFEHLNTLRVMCLPIFNFNAKELIDLCELFKSLSFSNKLAITDVERCISMLLKRKRPKKKSSFPNQYIFDDCHYGFEFGMEKHSSIETSEPPHSKLCILSGTFRFGQRIEANKHFNVTRGEKDKEKISGTFLNCHLIKEIVKGESHINMFPNGFFKKGTVE